jgi:hypothetical protein
MKRIILIVAIASCHSQPRSTLSAEQRISASLARWGDALRRGDNAALSQAEDKGGQIAVGYVALKALSSRVPNGEAAVEKTMFMLLAQTFFQTLWPQHFGAPFQSFDVYLPAGSYAPALVAAGLADQDANNPELAIVPMSWQSSIGRIEDASRDHRRKLVERAAWTCRLESLEKTILPTEPTIQRAALISQNIFASWLQHIEAVWLVRAQCASGPALFAISGRKDGKDRILLAKLL